MRAPKSEGAYGQKRNCSQPNGPIFNLTTAQAQMYQAEQQPRNEHCIVS